MKVHQELSITGRRRGIDAVLNEIEKKQPNGWRRDEHRQRGLKLGTALDSACFRCDKRGEHEEAWVFLFLRDDDRGMELTNIVPSGKTVHRLSLEEYNTILKDFASVLKDARGEHKIEVTMSQDEETLENWMAADTAHKLRSFSDLANKSTGSSHPMDQERWYQFLIAAHREKIRMSPEDLRRWLHEDEGWGEENAWELSIQYEAAMSLLKFYDAN